MLTKTSAASYIFPNFVYCVFFFILRSRVLFSADWTSFFLYICIKTGYTHVATHNTKQYVWNGRGILFSFWIREMVRSIYDLEGCNVYIFRTWPFRSSFLSSERTMSVGDETRHSLAQPLFLSLALDKGQNPQRFRICEQLWEPGRRNF